MNIGWTFCDNPECGATADTYPREWLQWWDLSLSPPGAVRDELISGGQRVTDFTITACSMRCLMIAFVQLLERLPVAS